MTTVAKTVRDQLPMPLNGTYRLVNPTNPALTDPALIRGGGNMRFQSPGAAARHGWQVSDDRITMREMDEREYAGIVGVDAIQQARAD